MTPLLMPVEKGFDVTAMWSKDALLYSEPPFSHLDDGYGDAVSNYNPTPGVWVAGDTMVTPSACIVLYASRSSTQELAKPGI